MSASPETLDREAPPEKNSEHTSWQVLRKNRKDGTHVAKTSPIESICLIARHPGAAAYACAVAENLINSGVAVHFILSDKGQTQVVERFQHHNDFELVPQATTPLVRWAAVFADLPADFEVVALTNLRAQNPDLQIVAAEEVPGSLQPMLGALLDTQEGTDGNQSVSFTPHIILTTTRAMATEYFATFPQLQQVPVIPIGQPSFDLSKEEAAIRREIARQKILELSGFTESEDAHIILFVGVPEGDYPHIPIASTSEITTQYEDLNSHALNISLQATFDAARATPGENFCIIYKPHPRSPDNMKNHPYLTQLNNLIASYRLTNLRVLYLPEADWRQQELTTKDLTIASDRVITTVSTVGQEAAVIHARRIFDNSHQPIIVLPQEYVAAFATMDADKQNPLPVSAQDALAGSQLLEQFGAATIIRTLTDIYQMFQSLIQITHESGAHTITTGDSTLQGLSLRDDYRLKATAAIRFVYWLLAVERRNRLSI